MEKMIKIHFFIILLSLDPVAGLGTRPGKIARLLDEGQPPEPLRGLLREFKGGVYFTQREGPFPLPPQTRGQFLNFPFLGLQNPFLAGECKLVTRNPEPKGPPAKEGNGGGPQLQCQRQPSGIHRAPECHPKEHPNNQLLKPPARIQMEEERPIKLPGKTLHQFLIKRNHFIRRP